MSGLALRPLDRDGLRRLYRQEIRPTFPLSERRPLSSMLRLERAGVYRPLALTDGRELLAYALIWEEGESGYALLDYLGVPAPLRGRGLGSRMLALLLENRQGRPGLLAEVEAPEPRAGRTVNGRRQRRIAFYRRAGFLPLPYEAEVFRVRYAMLLGGAGEGTAAMAAHQRLYRSEFSPLVYRRMIRIPAPPAGQA